MSAFSFSDKGAAGVVVDHADCTCTCICPHIDPRDQPPCEHDLSLFAERDADIVEALFVPFDHVTTERFNDTSIIVYVGKAAVRYRVTCDGKVSLAHYQTLCAPEMVNPKSRAKNPEMVRPWRDTFYAPVPATTLVAYLGREIPWPFKERRPV